MRKENGQSLEAAELLLLLAKEMKLAERPAEWSEEKYIIDTHARTGRKNCVFYGGPKGADIHFQPDEYDNQFIQLDEWLLAHDEIISIYKRKRASTANISQRSSTPILFIMDTKRGLIRVYGRTAKEAEVFAAIEFASRGNR